MSKEYKYALINTLMKRLGVVKTPKFEERNATVTQAFVKDFLREIPVTKHKTTPRDSPPPLATPRFKKTQKRVKSQKRVK